MFLHSVGEDGVVFVGEFNPLGLSVLAAADEADNRLENADEVDEGEKRQQVDNGDIGAAAGHGGADDATFDVDTSAGGGFHAFDLGGERGDVGDQVFLGEADLSNDQSNVSSGVVSPSSHAPPGNETCPL